MPIIVNRGGGGTLDYNSLNNKPEPIIEIEIDFGTIPVYGKDFTITDASVSLTSKIIAYLSGNTATGRVGNDFTWDSLSLSAVAGTGDFVLSALSLNGSLVGKRKIYYNVIK